MPQSALSLLAVYCVLIACASLFGGLLPTLVRLTHRRMQFLVSLIGGLMLGVGVLHQLPHAIAVMSQHQQEFVINWCAGWLLAGLLTMFFMIRMFHFHNHEPVALDDDPEHLCGHDHSKHSSSADCLAKHDHDHDHSHHHDHDHDHGKDCGHNLGHTHSHHPSQGASWVGIFLGLSLHTLIDGGALAAHVASDARHGADHSHSVMWLFGLGTFLGVLLHKPLDSLAITTLMTAGGWSSRTKQLVNVVYALMCPMGAIAFVLGIRQFGANQDYALAAGLAFSAGVFICISLSDLLPEVQFHSHDRLWLSLALLSGIMLAFLIGYVEPAHVHGGTDHFEGQLVPGTEHKHSHPHKHDHGSKHDLGK